MAEIRNLTRNGETFYPQTHIEGVLDPGDNYIGHYEENPEYLKVELDHEGKIIKGIKNDGIEVFGVGYEVGDFVTTTIDNPEFLIVYLDNQDRILWGIQKDGSILFSNVPQVVKDYVEQILKPIKEKLISIEDTVGSYIDNPEFVQIKTDFEDKILEAIKLDGTKVLPAGIEFKGNKIKSIEDPENRMEIKTDSDEKIISYRKLDGTLVENAGIETNHLELTKQGMTDFQKALKDAGFNPGGGGDWSDRNTIELPEPEHYSLLNIVVESLPINDSDISVGYVEYYDGLGNYFKMPCELAAQGQSSRVFAQTRGKGNYTLDLPKDVKFGSWVPQDSFHLKGAAKDISRGVLASSYKYAYTIQEYLDSRPDRVLMDEDAITTTNGTGERITDWPTDARCLPDGFPVEFYVNGEYWGLFALQLKKHRKNYSMDKKDYTSFFIDPDRIMTINYQNGIWNDGPDATIPGTDLTWWTGFDIKGPKDLVCMDGSAFDGDNPKELIDETSEFYDPSNKAHKGSRTTKNLIRSMSTRYNEVKYEIAAASVDPSTVEDWSYEKTYTYGDVVRESYKLWMCIAEFSWDARPGYHDDIWKEFISGDLQTAKEKFNEYFDYNACMLVYIFNCLMMNGDSISKNTLWGIYKSGKIFPLLWDLDAMYGQEWTGTWCYAPSAYLWNTYKNAAWPLALFATLYEAEIKAEYNNLRSDKVISIESWKNIVFGQWFKKIGQSAFERDLERWPETPSYRENCTDTDYWVELGISREGDYPIWNAETSYNTNNIVQLPMYYSSTWYIKYKAVQGSTNKCPVTKFYDGFPQVGGYYDSPKRWERWMARQIELCDNFIGYTE